MSVNGERENGILRAGALEIREADRLALIDGQALWLSIRELELLAELVRGRGRVMPRPELYATVWGAPLRERDRSLDVYVHKLRTKLEQAAPHYRFIHTQFGFGYRLEPEPAIREDISR